MTPQERQARIARLLLGDETICMSCLRVMRFKDDAINLFCAMGNGCNRRGFTCETCRKKHSAVAIACFQCREERDSRSV